MKVIVCKDYEDGSRIAASIIEDIVRNKPDCTLGLATGSSPVGMYKELIRKCCEEGLDFSKVSSVNLDEYVGLSGDNPQSYRYFMDENLFNHINIDKANTHVISGVGDTDTSIREYRELLSTMEVDIQVLGVGVDGHLGFNEPADALHDSVHKEKLDASTIEANKRFFDSINEVPKEAITMGMGDIMRAKKLLLIISGDKQEAARRLLMEEKIDTSCPITFLRLHRDAIVIIEKSLADKISYR